MNNEKVRKIVLIFIIIIGFSLLVFGIMFSINGSSKSEKNSKYKLISTNDYEVSYVIDNNKIDLVFTNKTDKNINVFKIIIKNEEKIISERELHYLILSGIKNQLSIQNDMNIEKSTKLIFELYTSNGKIDGDSEQLVDSYICSMPTKKIDEYEETYYYKFDYFDGNLYLPEVYREYKFQTEEDLKNFTLPVTVDNPDDIVTGKMSFDMDNLTSKFYFEKEYPIPDSIDNIDDYLLYLKENFGYNCENNRKS